MKTNIRAILSIASLMAATSAVATDPADFFWRQLQLTDGASLAQTTPRPKADPAVEQRPAMANQDWFALERRKTDGYNDRGTALAETTHGKRMAETDRHAAR